ncbi:MAG: DHA2 family efflux MFS transporter permease subunit [Hyphomicrobiales bacterium]|nr:DHA2 family efflux MFS transporter permease subunit [Hyphomicrobiales bacterium]MBV9052473.1 DHA2 family efflux MFS transporter permease subunit [Hyphomicrobiales bacterium]
MSQNDPDAGWTRDRSAAGSRNPWLIAAILSIATFMEVLDTSIANVALRHIAGALSASIDESTWIITSYLVSNAIILPVSGWLAGVIGRKRFYMLSVALFTASSLACGLAPNLASLITARVFQGAGGGGLAPNEQSMLADTFPPSKRAQAFALYGVTVIVAPALGPTIGGAITDNISWHWIFFINVPMGILSLFLVYLFVDEPETMRRERQEHLRGGLKIDWIGFVLVALWLGCLEIVLDKGQEDDWFNSTFIICVAAVSGLAFLLFVPWELTRKEPIVDIRLIAHRQFGTSWFVMLSVGVILFSSTQFMPQLLQENFGYTATLAGLALMPGGFAALVTMMIAGRISGFVQPRYMMAGAMVTIAIAMYHFTSLTPDVNFAWFALARVFQMMAIPILFLTITSYSYVGLPPEKSSQASALINVARNLGGSIGVSMAQTLLARREQFHQARLAEHVSSSSLAYRDTLHQASDYFAAHGATGPDAQSRAIAWVGQTLMNQAAYLSYIDVFAALAALAALLVPVAFLLRRVDLARKPAHAG